VIEGGARRRARRRPARRNGKRDPSRRGSSGGLPRASSTMRACAPSCGRRARRRCGRRRCGARNLLRLAWASKQIEASERLDRGELGWGALRRRGSAPVRRAGGRHGLRATAASERLRLAHELGERRGSCRSRLEARSARRERGKKARGGDAQERERRRSGTGLGVRVRCAGRPAARGGPATCICTTRSRGNPIQHYSCGSVPWVARVDVDVCSRRATGGSRPAPATSR